MGFTLVQQHAPLPVRTPDPHPVHEGRGILVTGAARGLGLAVAELLLAEGAQVVLADVLAGPVHEAAASLGGADAGAYPLVVDVSDPASVASAVATADARLARLSGLVNAAGVVIHADPLAVPRTDWHRQLEVNLVGCYELSALVARHMVEHGVAGAIVSIASEAGKVGHTQSLAYSASKAGVISMTRMLSEALAPHDINVNCVCPGGMPTEMLREVSRVYSGIAGEPADQIFEEMVSPQLGRHTTPTEVARVVSFLLSDAALVVRGQALNADAGGTPY